MGIFIDVAIVVITDKWKVVGLVVDTQSEDDQEQGKNKRPLL